MRPARLCAAIVVALAWAMALLPVSAAQVVVAAESPNAAPVALALGASTSSDPTSTAGDGSSDGASVIVDVAALLGMDGDDGTASPLAEMARVSREMNAMMDAAFSAPLVDVIDAASAGALRAGTSETAGALPSLGSLIETILDDFADDADTNIAGSAADAIDLLAAAQTPFVTAAAAAAGATPSVTVETVTHMPGPAGRSLSHATGSADVGAGAGGSGGARTVTRVSSGVSPDGRTAYRSVTTTTMDDSVRSSVYSSSSSSSYTYSAAAAAPLGAGTGAGVRRRPLAASRRSLMRTTSTGVSASAADGSSDEPAVVYASQAEALDAARAMFASGVASGALEKLARKTKLKQLELGLEALGGDDYDVDAKGRPWPREGTTAIADRVDGGAKAKETKAIGAPDGATAVAADIGTGSKASSNAVAKPSSSGTGGHLVGPDGRRVNHLHELTIDTPGDGADIEETIHSTAERLGKHYNVRKTKHRLPAEHTHFHVSADNLVPHGDHYHRQSEADRDSGMILLFLIATLLVSQFVLKLWKQHAQRSFDVTMLLGLWLIPPVFSVYLRYWRFLIVWALFSVATLRLIGGAIAAKQGVGLSQTTPRRVYQWFFTAFKVCYGTAFTGWVLLLLHLSGIPVVLGILVFGTPEFLQASVTAATAAAGAGAGAAEATVAASVAATAVAAASPPPLTAMLWVGDLGLHLIFYGLYFGVLGRDLAAVITATIAAHMGYAPKDLLPARKLLAILPKRFRRGLLAPRKADGNGLRMRRVRGDADPGAGAGAGVQASPPYDAGSDSDGDSDDGSEDKRALLSSSGGRADDDNDDGDGAAPASEGAGASEKPRSSVSGQAVVGDNMCAICDTTLLPPVAEGANPAEAEAVHGLPCGHTFHEFCLRGWLLVGKHDTCALCREKCSVKATLAVDQPWELQNSAWSGILDVVRMVIVFNPILVVVNYVLVLVY